MLAVDLYKYMEGTTLGGKQGSSHSMNWICEIHQFAIFHMLNVTLKYKDLF